MKVYVTTKAKLLKPEMYMFVKSSKKEAEKALRSISPYMRPTESSRQGVSAFFADSSNQALFFIHEEEI